MNHLQTQLTAALQWLPLARWLAAAPLADTCSLARVALTDCAPSLSSPPALRRAAFLQKTLSSLVEGIPLPTALRSAADVTDDEIKAVAARAGFAFAPPPAAAPAITEGAAGGDDGGEEVDGDGGGGGDGDDSSGSDIEDLDAMVEAEEAGYAD